MSSSEASVGTGDPRPAATVASAPPPDEEIAALPVPPAPGAASVVRLNDAASSAAPPKAPGTATVVRLNDSANNNASSVGSGVTEGSTELFGSQSAASSASAGSAASAASVGSVGSAGSAGSNNSNEPEGDDHYFYFYTKSGIDGLLADDSNGLFKMPVIMVSSMDGFDEDGMNFLDEISNTSSILGFNGYAAMNAIIQTTRKTRTPKKEIMALICGLPTFPLVSELVLPTQLLFFVFLNQMILYGKLQGAKTLDIQTATFKDKFNYVQEETKKAYQDTTKPKREIFGIDTQTMKTGYKETEEEKEEKSVSWWERVKADTGAFAFVNAADVDLDDFVEIFNIGPLALLELLEIEKNFYNNLGEDSEMKSVIKDLQKYAELDEVAFESNAGLRDVLKETIRGIHADPESTAFVFKDAAELIAKIKENLEAKKAAAAGAAGKEDGTQISFETEDESGDDSDDDSDSGSDSGSDGRPSAKTTAKKPKYPHGANENARISKIIGETHPTAGTGVKFPSVTSMFGKKPAAGTPGSTAVPAGKKPDAPAVPGSAAGKKPEAPAAPVATAPPPSPMRKPAPPGGLIATAGMESPPRIVIPGVSAAAPTDATGCSKPPGNVNDSLINVGPAVPCTTSGGHRGTRKNRKVL
jgi:hypothetical protein